MQEWGEENKIKQPYTEKEKIIPYASLSTKTNACSRKVKLEQQVTCKSRA